MKQTVSGMRLQVKSKNNSLIDYEKSISEAKCSSLTKKLERILLLVQYLYIIDISVNLIRIKGET